MENLKLISVRIDPETLRKLDEFCSHHYYWKRNTVINGILTAVVDAMDKGTLYDMVRYNRISGYNPSGTFSISLDDKTYIKNTCSGK